jgi:hypothetical protein
MTSLSNTTAINWMKKQFAEKHILFLERSGLDSYLKVISQNDGLIWNH